MPREFIVNLKNVKHIRPFARCWVKRNHKLLGFLVNHDGGRPGLGSCLYAISTEDDEHIEKALCLADGRLSKRNIVAHEILSKVLAGEDLYRLVQPLLYDHSETALRFYIKGDSLCGLAMLNSQISIKSTLLENAIKSYLDTLMKITIEFKRSKILLGYCQSENNPADLMTKVFRDPCSIINSDFYRHGDSNLKTIKDLETDTVARVEGGVFTFLGIPERFLAGKQERCLHCAEEECPLVQIVQSRRQEKEKESQDLETDTVAEVEGGVFTFLGIPERFLVGKQERCLHCAEEECPLVQIVQTRRQEKEK